MYIMINNSGLVNAIYNEETHMPEAVKAKAVFVETMPAKPGESFRLKYSPETGLFWEEIIRKTYLSKLAVRRELRAMGMEEMLDQYLETNPVYKRDWMDADALELADPAFASAWDVMKQQIENPDAFLKRVRI